jgi:hypothetical protein
VEAAYRAAIEDDDHDYSLSVVYIRGGQAEYGLGLTLSSLGKKALFWRRRSRC